MSSAFMQRSNGSTLKNSSFQSDKQGKNMPRSRSFTAVVSRIFNMIYSGALHIYKRIRSFLWIGSTALIFLLIPVGFSMLSQSEIEYAKLERASEIAAGRGSMGGSVRGSF